MFQDQNARWGLGHLRYQEHLTALELKENPDVSCGNLVGSDWWLPVLRMYAEMTRDISRLIRDADRRGTLERNLRRLHELLQLAPNTSADERKMVERLCDMNSAVKESMEKYSDWDIIMGKGRPY